MAEAERLWTVPNGQRLSDPQIISKYAQIRTATSQVKQFQQWVRSTECNKSVIYKQICSSPSYFVKRRTSRDASNCLVNRKCLAIYCIRWFTDVLTKARHRSPTLRHMNLAHTVLLCADKSLARPGRKQATATEYFDVHISYL
jgi:hypothetical protein